MPCLGLPFAKSGFGLGKAFVFAFVTFFTSLVFAFVDLFAGLAFAFLTAFFFAVFAAFQHAH